MISMHVSSLPPLHISCYMHVKQTCLYGYIVILHSYLLFS